MNCRSIIEIKPAHASSMMIKPLILCLGNDIIADDAVGIQAARLLRERVGDFADVEECAVSGVALLEFFVGYNRAIIVDAIQTRRHPPGTILEMKPSDLGRIIAPSPHYAGLPELIGMAAQMELDFPSEIVIFGVEVEDLLTVGGEMTESARNALPRLLERIDRQLEQWNANWVSA